MNNIRPTWVLSSPWFYWWTTLDQPWVLSSPCFYSWTKSYYRESLIVLGPIRLCDSLIVPGPYTWTRLDYREPPIISLSYSWTRLDYCESLVTPGCICKQDNEFRVISAHAVLCVNSCSLLFQLSPKYQTSTYPCSLYWQQQYYCLGIKLRDANESSAYGYHNCLKVQLCLTARVFPLLSQRND